MPTIRDADARNIFVLGQGMGGDVALRALEATDRVRAASLWAPVAAPMPLGLVYYTRARREAVEGRIRTQYGEAELPKLATVGIPRPAVGAAGDPSRDGRRARPARVERGPGREAGQAGLPHRFFSYDGGDNALSRQGFRLALARVYKDNPKCELVAVCDIIKEKADAAAAKFGAKAFYSVKEMLASGIKLDACSMCTRGEENGGDHFTPTMELLEAGIPVLGEKPISNRIDEGEKMVALAAKKNVPYAINLNHRFTPAALRRQGVGRRRAGSGSSHMINMRMWINNPVETSPVVPPARAASALVRRHALLLRRREERGRLPDEGRGPDDLVERPGAAALRERRGRQPDRQLRRRRQLRPGALRGRRLEGPVRARGRLRAPASSTRATASRSRPTTTSAACARSARPSRAASARGWTRSRRRRSPAQIDGSGADGLKVQRIIEAAIKSWETHAIVDL